MNEVLSNFDALRQVVIHDTNIKSVAYNELENTMIVIFGGGSKWKYFKVPSEVFEKIADTCNGNVVLEEIRHNNLVGIRVR